jgi:hypothetical protein
VDAGHGGHADAGRDIRRRTGHHRLAARSSGCGGQRGSPQPSGGPGHHLRPAPVTTHPVCVVGHAGHLGRVRLPVAEFERPVPFSFTGPQIVLPVLESHTGVHVVDADSDADGDSHPDPDSDPHDLPVPHPDSDPHDLPVPDRDSDSHHVPVPDRDRVPVADSDRVRVADSHGVPSS